MHKLIITFLLGFALLTPHLTFAADGEAVASDLAKYWANRAKQHRAIKQHQAMLRRRRRPSRETVIPPWIKYKEPNDDGQKELTLEDIQLWSSIDLDKDGKLTVSEFDRFVRSPTSAAFVAQMKSEKAIKAWADKVGIDVAKAKQAMALGAQSQAARIRAANMQRIQRQRAMQQQQYRNRVFQQTRANNYFANLGRQYYRAVSGRGGRRDEL